jgi:glyoxylate reductase
VLEQNSRVKVLATRRFPGPAWGELDNVEYLDGPLPAGLGGVRKGVGALAVVAEAVDQGTLDLLPDLRLVANYGVGYDAIDVSACRRRGVSVSNTPGKLGSATADLTLALLLAVRRRLVEGDRVVRAGTWGSAWHASELMGDEIGGAVLGIVGLGRIGREVAKRAHAFGLIVRYTQRHRLSVEEEVELGVEYRSLDDLLRESDVITLHAPLTQETTRLLDANRLALMRDGATLINTARGAVVDEPALVTELVSGRLHAGLDVFLNEPNVPRELLDLPNVVLTPHLGSATHGAREHATRVLVDNILAVARGDPPPNSVN